MIRLHYTIHTPEQVEILTAGYDDLQILQVGSQTWRLYAAVAAASYNPVKKSPGRIALCP